MGASEAHDPENEEGGREQEPASLHDALEASTGEEQASSQEPQDPSTQEEQSQHHDDESGGNTVDAWDSWGAGGGSNWDGGSTWGSNWNAGSSRWEGGGTEADKSQQQQAEQDQPPSESPEASSQGDFPSRPPGFFFLPCEWQWKTSSGTWCPMDPSWWKDLDKALRQEKPNLILGHWWKKNKKWVETNYDVDLQAMTQRNVDSGSVRPIRAMMQVKPLPGEAWSQGESCSSGDPWSAGADPWQQKPEEDAGASTQASSQAGNPAASTDGPPPPPPGEPTAEDEKVVPPPPPPTKTEATQASSQEMPTEQMPEQPPPPPGPPPATAPVPPKTAATAPAGPPAAKKASVKPATESPPPAMASGPAPSGGEAAVPLPKAAGQDTKAASQGNLRGRSPQPYSQTPCQDAVRGHAPERQVRFEDQKTSEAADKTAATAVSQETSVGASPAAAAVQKPAPPARPTPARRETAVGASPAAAAVPKPAPPVLGKSTAVGAAETSGMASSQGRDHEVLQSLDVADDPEVIECELPPLPTQPITKAPPASVVGSHVPGACHRAARR